MFALFFLSLLQPPSMIERFARIVEPNLPETGVWYTRQVTKIWCAFFVLNGAAALYTSTVASMEIWTLYNGSIAYALMRSEEHTSELHSLMRISYAVFCLK